MKLPLGIVGVTEEAHLRPPRLRRRGLDETVVRHVLAVPEQRIAVRPGREVVHSKIELAGRRYLAPVFVDVDRSPAEVVTAYRTSKIDKYWRRQS